MKIKEGYMPYLGYETYYRIVEPDTDPAGKQEDQAKAPLVLLHGGPGSTHDYMEVLDHLADETGRRIITYDQIGCGKSYVDGHPELWRMETWVGELKALRIELGLDKIHLLGQSFGGMLALQYLIDEKPEGVESVILSSTLSASWLWSHEQHRRLKFMSREDQEAIACAERTGNYDGEAYKKANAHFMLRYCQGELTADVPECVSRPKKYGDESYLCAWGPNEYTPEGTLKDYDVTERLGEVSCPALIISGTNDLCSPYIAKIMYDGIPDSRWELFDGARHMCFVEEHGRYCEVLKDWLSDV